MEENNKDLYFVAVKAFLVDVDGHFLITKDRFGDWDIPGGRLKEQDFNLQLEDVLGRKIKEELGEELKYTIGEPAVFMRHERNEILQSGEREKRRIFAVGYLVRFQGGDVVLGRNHEIYEWVPIKNFKPEDRFTGGWLKGVKEFQERFEKQKLEL